MSNLRTVLLKIVFLMTGVLVAQTIFQTTLKSTENPMIAMLGYAATLAFWIGTLSVVWKITKGI